MCIERKLAGSNNPTLFKYLRPIIIKRKYLQFLTSHIEQSLLVVEQIAIDSNLAAETTTACMSISREPCYAKKN